MTNIPTEAPAGAGRLFGQSAVITGASRGIGLGIARQFAKEGAAILLVATNGKNLEAAQRVLEPLGSPVEVWPADVSDRDSCRKVAQRATQLYGKVDILVNGAAVYKAASFLDYGPEDFQRILDVKLHGLVHMMQAVLPGMVERKYGKVVNVASTAGKWATKNQAAYNVSKHAVIGLTRCTAMEFATHGITINALCPGMVQTDLAEQLLQEHANLSGSSPDAVKGELLKRIAQGRFLDVEECGHLAVYLASREARGMTGQSVLLDGGML